MTTETKEQEKWISLKSFAVLLIFVGLVYLGVVQLAPPVARGKGVPAGQFSAAQALVYLQALAQKPRPLHSTEKERVRDYLLYELRGLGLEPIIQKGCRKDEMGIAMWNLENIMVRLNGSASTGLVTVVMHYDSVPGGPGASDDGAAVAAALTSIRELRLLPPLKNDILFLFSDGEEYGLLGAFQFAETHPWMKEIKLVLNYEARGHKGPSLMFQTNPQNGWVIPAFAKAAPYPRAYSWSDEVYKRMPNDTDFSVFQRQGITGLNFAFIGGWRYYHSRNDNLKTISHDSIQHHGENMLPLIKYFGNLNLTTTKGTDQVYFTVFNTLIHYSVPVARGLLLILGLAFIGFLASAVRQKELKASHLLWSLLLVMLTVVVAVVLLWLASKTIHGRKPDLHAGYYTAALACLAAGIFRLLYYFYIKWFSFEHLFAGVLLFFMILGVATGVVAPGASFLFTWSLFFGLLALTWQKKRKKLGWPDLLWHTALLLPSALILVPASVLTIDALTFRFGIFITAFFFIMLASMALPLWHYTLKACRLRLPILLISVSVILLLLGK